MHFKNDAMFSAFRFFPPFEALCSDSISSKIEYVYVLKNDNQNLAVLSHDHVTVKLVKD